MVTGLKYVSTIYYQISTFYTAKNELSPFYIKLLIKMCAAIFLVPPTRDSRD
jgi:hypothetical protein